jgi:nitrite reductase/ring-hydroxylating ferredoxin subunit
VRHKSNNETKDARLRADFVEVARLEELPPGRSTTVTIGKRSIALFNVEGTVYATDDSCLFAGSSLGAGELDGKVIRCRGRGWSYDVTTGCVLGFPGLGVSAHAVKVVDGRIMVAVD